MALSLLSLLCSVNEHYILLIIHRILTPYRRSETHGRKDNLVLVSFQGVATGVYRYIYPKNLLILT